VLRYVAGSCSSIDCILCMLLSPFHECYSISDIENLEVLNISRNNLSEGLQGNIFESLLKLRELYMHHCDLVTLPKRWV